MQILFYLLLLRKLLDLNTSRKTIVIFRSKFTLKSILSLVLQSPCFYIPLHSARPKVRCRVWLTMGLCMWCATASSSGWQMCCSGALLTTAVAAVWEGSDGTPPYTHTHTHRDRDGRAYILAYWYMARQGRTIFILHWYVMYNRYLRHAAESFM